MRGFAIVVIVAACIGAAFAQDAPTDGRFMPQWDQRPSAQDFARHFPRSALGEGHPGMAVLCCTPREDRRLDCRVGYEWPADRRFGDAALRIAESFRLSPESYAAYQADPEAWLQIPIRFQVSPTPREWPAISQRISEGTRGLCAPPGTAPGETQQPIDMTVH